jgi:hypothetical protein
MATVGVDEAHDSIAAILRGDEGQPPRCGARCPVRSTRAQPTPGPSRATRNASSPTAAKAVARSSSAAATRARTTRDLPPLEVSCYPSTDHYKLSNIGNDNCHRQQSVTKNVKQIKSKSTPAEPQHSTILVPRLKGQVMSAR